MPDAGGDAHTADNFHVELCQRLQLRRGHGEVRQAPRRNRTGCGCECGSSGSGTGTSTGTRPGGVLEWRYAEEENVVRNMSREAERRGDGQRHRRRDRDRDRDRMAE